MAIKEVPTNIRMYYKSFIDDTKEKRKHTISELDTATKQAEEKYNIVKDNIAIYKDNFNVDLSKYEEFTNQTFSTGELFKVAKGLFINRSNAYQLVTELYDLYSYATYQKTIHSLNSTIALYDKILNLNFVEYTNLFRTYMIAVHKAMILQGYGYVFHEGMGWICINRCLLVNPKPHIDYAATKKRKAQLKLEGKRLYDKEEAEWCKQNGIEYKAEDGRVYDSKEYVYEIPLINCTLTNGSKYKLEISDYRHASIRGKTNDDLIKECNSDVNKICELPIDMKTKLTLCDKVNKILYTKFIRNEDQKPIISAKIDRKNRQRF